MIFEVKNRVITRIDEEVNCPIGDNSDYVAEFHFDAEWEGRIKTARFVRDCRYSEQILENDKCKIPVEILKFGYMKVGVFTTDITTTECEVLVRRSIKQENGVTEPPTPDVYSQIISMIENMEASVVTDEQIKNAVAKYLLENPIDTITESDVQRIVSEYVVAHKEELKGDKGDKGDTGANGITPNLTIGTVETLDAGTSATATITGDKENPVLNLGIPKGADGQGGSGDITTKILIDTLSANRHRDFAFRDMPKAQIALVVDDCLPTVISLCVTNAKAKNVPLNMSAISEYFDDLCTKGNTSATVLDEIKRGVANGGEVLLHGNGTINADNINDESVLKQKFLDEKELFISRGLNPRGAIVIGGGNEIYNDARTDRWVRALYDYSDGWGIGEPYAHRRLAPTTLDSAKSYIDSAVANKSFIVIFAHKWYDFWNDMIDYARNLGAEFVTYADVYDTYGTTKSVKAMENRIKALEQGGGSTKVLTSISASKTKTLYNVGDTLNTDDITVIAHYSDESTENVTSDAIISTSGVVMSASGNYDIFIEYNGQSTTIAITVSNVEPTPSGTVIYEIASISGTCDGTKDLKLGNSSTQWTAGKQYRYVFDYEVTSVQDAETTVSIRDVNGSDLGVALSNATVGQTGHIDKTINNGSTRQRQAFLLKNYDKSYSVTITNVTVTEL